MAREPARQEVADRPVAWPLPIETVLADIYALHAIIIGEATKEQQVRAMKWIILTAAASYKPSFNVASDRVTAFAEGRRYVGMAINHAAMMSSDEIETWKQNDVRNKTTG